MLIATAILVLMHDYTYLQLKQLMVSHTTCTPPTVQDPLWNCVFIINRYSTLLNSPIVSLLILFVLFSNIFVF